MINELRISPSGPSQLVGSPIPITQTEWFIDADTGDDDNDGDTGLTALRTLEGFMARVEGGIFESPTTVEIRGDHSGENLQGSFQLANGATVQFSGMSATVVDSDTITTFTATNAAASEASLVDVTAKDWTPFINKRIRITSGDATGSVAWIAIDDPDSAGTNIVRTSAFGDIPLFGFLAPSNPSGGDDFVIEDLTPIGGVDLDVYSGETSSGKVAIWFEDFESSDSKKFSVRSGNVFSTTQIVRSVCGVVEAGAAISLCHYPGGIASSETPIALQACLFTAARTQVDAKITSISFSIFQAARLVCVGRQVFLLFDTGVFDVVEDEGVNVQGMCLLNMPVGTLYGSNIENEGVVVDPAAVMTFATLPTISGTVGDVRIGGTLTTWGALPADTVTTKGAGVYAS